MKPSAWLLWVSAAWVVFTLFGLWVPACVSASLPLGITLAAVALIDALWCLNMSRPVISRELPGIVNRDQLFVVRLELQCLPTSRNIRLHDGLPNGFTSQQLPILLGRSPAGEGRTGLELSYQVIANKRGEYQFTPCWCHFQSRLGLWWRLTRSGPAQAIKVFPPFWKEESTHLALMAGVANAGAVHSVRRRGQGTEFHQLREYRPGDSIRSLDWKATSRFRKPIVREYQEEQNQEIIFILDTGYRMHATEGGVSHFDRALESLLLLSRVALRQGDSVGVLTFGPFERWIAPVKGLSGMNLLLSRLYDLDSDAAASSPSAALEKLQGHLRRRSLIILLSNLREEDGEEVVPYLPRLLAHHLLLTLWLRENIVDELLQPPFRDVAAALTAASARIYLDDRQKIQKQWQRQGVLTIDTAPALLSSQLLNKYWEIKKSGRL